MPPKGKEDAVGASLKNAIDRGACIKFSQSLPKMLSKQSGLSTLERLKLFNTDEALDFSLLANADILAYIGTKEKFEGADEAVKFYQRNLRMYSNLNRIPLTKDDRVFILLGATHTAFMREFLAVKAEPWALSLSAPTQGNEDLVDKRSNYFDLHWSPVSFVSTFT